MYVVSVECCSDHILGFLVMYTSDMGSHMSQMTQAASVQHTGDQGGLQAAQRQRTGSRKQSRRLGWEHRAGSRRQNGGKTLEGAGLIRGLPAKKMAPTDTE